MTLEQWTHLLRPTPYTLSFPHLELLSGYDHEPPAFIGSGEIHVRTPDNFDYSLTGQSTDDHAVLQRFERAQANPYEVRDQFRLTGKDAQGVNWTFGWTTPIVNDFDGSTWSISGDILTLSPDSNGVSVSSAENIIEFPPTHPLAPIIGLATAHHAGKSVHIREHCMQVLGNEIEFVYRPVERTLIITCPTSPNLPHPYLESWLSEPLRIISGQLLYPRLVARNFGDGRAFVSMRRAPNVIGRAGFAALWNGDIGAKNGATFWKLYEQLLTFIAKAHDKDGNPNFQEHPLTQFYEEVTQTARSTRWVWAMTLASVIEGQTKMLAPEDAPVPSGDDPIDHLCKHIKTWKGSNDLKSRVIDYLNRPRQATAPNVLARLKRQGIVTAGEFDSWKHLRNEVMHGNLISRWSEREEDERLSRLASLFHKLTMLILQTS